MGNPGFESGNDPLAEDWNITATAGAASSGSTLLAANPVPRDAARRTCFPGASLGSSCSYLNTSLCLDSGDLICYRATALAARNRFKLRARWYAGDMSCGTVIEEKRRADNAIMKVRSSLLPGSIERVNAGEPLSESMAAGGEGEGAPLQYLMELASRHAAGPSCTVRYRREAWISSTAYVRVSFDMDPEGHALTVLPPAVDSPGWERVDLPGVIVEFKFEHEAPQWMGDIARRVDLRRRSIPKYLLCIDHLARSRDFQHIAELPRWRTAWTA